MHQEKSKLSLYVTEFLKKKFWLKTLELVETSNTEFVEGLEVTQKADKIWESLA